VIPKAVNSKGRRWMMKRIGLDRLAVVSIFRRSLADEVERNPLIKSIAKAVGETVEENNKQLLRDLGEFFGRGK
jgi:hypothetical protein